MEVKDYGVGESMVKNYKSSAFLYFPQNYTNHLSFYIDNIGTVNDSRFLIHGYFSKDSKQNYFQIEIC